MLLASPKIRLLDPHTVNQIAAGEVVERPASVVKELVENALDAGAKRVDVELTDSGRTCIRITDDGCGMTLEDAQMALQRHATSKIDSSEDLLGVMTLGFRGEALPSIASVSKLTLSSATQDGLKAVLRIDGGDVEVPEGKAGPKGTEISVEDLFYNTPARLKFLKSDTTELGAVIETLSRYAIGFPGVAFTLSHNGQNVLRTTGGGELLDAISNVWGRDLARSLAEVDVVVGGLRVSGFVSPPHVTKPTRSLQYVWVNGRPVRSRTLTAALDQAYRDITPEKRYAVLALMIEIDPARVDVNVSPTKSEVKFQHEGAAFDALRVAVKTALMEHGMIPSAEAVAAANEALAGTRQQPWGSYPPGDGSANFPLGTHFQGNIGAYSLDAQRPLDTLVPMPFSGIEAPQVSNERYPFGELIEGLRVLGQAMNTFIIAETARGIVIIDQHVAHERILYEYLCGLKGGSAIEKQPLLTPLTLELDRRSAILINEKLDELRRVGFELEPFGGESYIVRAAPAALRGKDPLKVLRDLVDELVEVSVTRRLVPTREQIWISSACKMAVKSGDPLSHAEMEKLIVDLASTENPYLCPHGRPITLTLSRDELFRKFKRT
ncbi:MAG: mismatch repair protein MutL [Fimbriimonadaceae bacterium]|jgi:DNA mismatch repair protein MutL|nr:mismatch repair protein MutL [Fimbriimonadaceae bacterium]